MTITALPTPPSRQRPETFSAEGDAFLAALPTFTTEANALAAEVNATAGEVAVNAASATYSAQTANFIGVWADLTGAVTVPSSVLHGGFYWQLLNDLADVTASEPGVTADWVELFMDTSSTGGKKTWNVAVNTTLTPERFHLITTTVDALSITLPSVVSFDEGGPLYVLTNSGGYDFYLKNSAGAYIGELSAKETYLVMLNSSATETYSFARLELNDLPIVTGTPTIYKAGTSFFTSICSIGTNKALAVYNVSGTMKAVVLTISDLAVSVGAETTVVASLVNGQYMLLSKIETDKALLVYQNTSNRPMTCVISVSGTTPAGGTPVQIVDLVTYVIDMLEVDTNKFLVCYTNSTIMEFNVLSISGTVPSVGTPSSTLASGTGTTHRLYKLSTTAVLSVYVNGVNTRAVVVSVSGTVANIAGSDATLNTYITNNYAIVLSASLVDIYSHNTASGATTVNRQSISISGSTITTLSSTLVNHLYTDYPPYGYACMELSTGEYLLVNNDQTSVFLQIGKSSPAVGLMLSYITRVTGYTKPTSRLLSMIRSITQIDTGKFLVQVASATSHCVTFVAKVGQI